MKLSNIRITASLKKYLRILFVGVFVTAFLMGCEKTIELDVTQAEPKIVIEAVLTDHLNRQFVKITRSGGFYETGKTLRVTDATVTITDDLGHVELYHHNPGADSEREGYYFPSTDFVAELGRTYSLFVEVDGVIYSARETLLPVTAIDSLGFQINPDQLADPKIPEKYYEVLLFATEPQETKDYYLFKFFRNDSLSLFNPTDIYFADDQILGEEISGVPSPVYYALGDTARVEMYSLTRSGYVFYNDLSFSLNNDGGIYGPPPANTRTNLSNGALGFFQVSSVSIKGVRID